MDSRKDLLFALAFVALGVAVILIAYSWPEPRIRDAVGPTAFPYGLGIIFIIGGAAVAGQRLRNMNAAGGYEVASEGNEDEPEHPASGIRALSMIALAFAYALLFNPLGYIIATTTFLAAAILLMNERNWVLVVVSSVAYTAITYVLFALLLNVRLPAGLLAGIL